jgi:diacylglycerol kinase
MIVKNPNDEIRMSNEILNPNDETVRVDEAHCVQPSAQPAALMSVRREAGAVDFDEPQHAHPRRPAWRQRLVQAERGLVRGVRNDSAFFVHFFGISIVIAAAVVLGIGWMQWIAIAGCLTLVLTAEMFNQALKALAQSGGQHSSPDGQRALAIGTAAVLVACVGSLIVLTLVFWQRFEQMFDG